MYVITDGINYIQKNYNGKYVCIKNAAMADEYDKTTAVKILNNHVPKKFRKNMRLEEIKYEPTVVSSKTKFETSSEISEWQNKVSYVVGIKKDALKRRNELCEELSELDKSISDILHYCEFENFNASQGYMLSKKIKDIRVQRRKVKDEINVVTTIINSDNNLQDNFLDTMDVLKNRTYTPRVIKKIF